MNRNLVLTLASTLGFVFFSPIRAHAEPQLGLGLVRSADSTQFQADLDLFRHVGVQGATGSSRDGALSGSAGGRFYLFGGHFSPYAGVLYNVQSAKSTDPAAKPGRNFQSQIAGPTLGLRLKANHGLGAFAEFQYLGDVDSNNRARPSVGAGIQWWF